MTTLSNYFRARGQVNSARSELHHAQQHAKQMQHQLIREAIAKDGFVEDEEGQRYQVKFSVSSVRQVEDKDDRKL